MMGKYAKYYPLLLVLIALGGLYFQYMSYQRISGKACSCEEETDHAYTPIE